MKRIVATIVLLSSLLAGCGGKNIPYADKTTSHTAKTTLQKEVNVSHAAVTKVALPYPRYGMAKLVGDQLYINVDDGAGFLNAIVKYDVKTREHNVVYTSKEDVVSVACNDDWLIWETGGKLFAQNMKTAKQQVISASRNLYAPALSKDLVAWIDKAENDSHVVTTYNLRTAQKHVIGKISLPGLYNNFIQINNNKIVWTDIKENNGYYCIYDLGTNTLTNHKSTNLQYPYPGYAMLGGDRVYSINFKDYEEWDWTQQQFGYISLASAKFTTLIKEDYINYFRQHGKWVAVIDRSQALRLYSVDKGSATEKDLSNIVNGSFNSIDFADNGRLVVGYSIMDKKTSVLYIINPDDI